MKGFLFSVCIALAILGCSGEDGEFPCLSCGRCPDPVVSNGSVTCGGQTYRTVKIGNQTWFAENLNYNASGSVCYDNNSSNCATYGRLYNWGTAMMVCPSGWHLPSRAEWNALSSYIESDSGCSNCDARHLKATSGWNSDDNGTDKYDFTALPGGFGDSGGSFRNVGIGIFRSCKSGYWWSASEYFDFLASGNFASGLYIYSCFNSADWNRDDKSYLQSVRCVKD